MPCRYRWENVEESGTLYFNPELDIIKLDPDSDGYDWNRSLASTPDYFADFAHRLWLNDPQRVGLTNFGLENLWLAEIDWEVRLAQKANVFRLREAVQRLRCVYFICCAPLTATWWRLVPEFVAAKNIYPLVHPAMILRSAFDRLSHDSRPIDLRAVYMGLENPRKQVQRWFSMLSRLQIPLEGRQADYRCMFTRQSTPRVTIKDRDTALKTLSWIWELDNKAMSRKGVNLNLGHNSFRELAFGF